MDWVSILMLVGVFIGCLAFKSYLRMKANLKKSISSFKKIGEAFTAIGNEESQVRTEIEGLLDKLSN